MTSRLARSFAALHRRALLALVMAATTVGVDGTAASAVRPSRGGRLRAFAAAVLACAALMGVNTDAQAGEKEIWSANLTVGVTTVVTNTYRGFLSGVSVGSLSDDEFTIGDTTYTVTELYARDSERIQFTLNAAGLNTSGGKLALYWGTTRFSLSDATVSGPSLLLALPSGFTLPSDGDVVAVRLVRVVPTITETAVTSSPASGDTYLRGETIEVTVTFDEAVDVTGTVLATLWFSQSTSTYRSAPYVRGSGTTELVFEYTVAEGDTDTDGLQAGPHILAEGGDPAMGVQGGGTITRKDASTVAADLASAALFSDAAHKVDGSPPTVPGAPALTATANGDRQIDLSWTAPTNTGGSVITDYDIEVCAAASCTAEADWSALDAGTVSTATTYSHMGLTAETTRSYRVRAVNANGDGKWSAVMSATTDVVRPRVVRADITSRPETGGDTYYRKEPIQATVTFDVPVKVTGTPKATLWLDGVWKGAAYHSGSGTRKLVFEYRVQAGDRDANGVTIGLNALALQADPSMGVQNGGTIKSVANDADAVLASAGVEDIAGHMVDGSVDTPPVLESADMPAQGDIINLNFDEDLTVSQTNLPAASAFTVKVNGAERSTTAVSLPHHARQVSVSFTPVAQYGDEVTVSYTPPAANPLQDAGGNHVLAFTDFPVQNNVARPASAPPVLESADMPAQGDIINLNFDEDLTVSQTNLPAASAFTVKVNGAERSTTAVSLPHHARQVSVSFTPVAQYGDEVTVSYTPPAANPLQDAGGNHVLAFTDFPVQNNVSRPASAPPALVDATMYNNTTLTLKFDEDLDGDSTAATSAFTVKVNGRTRTIRSVGVTRNPDDEVTVALGTPVVRHGDQVTVSYAPPSASPLQDDDGNRVVAFTDIAVRNLAPLPPVLESADMPAQGDIINLNFDEDLTVSQTNLPAASAFTVKVNGAERSTTAVSLPHHARQVSVSFTPVAQYGDEVTVSYTPPAANPLQDAGGNHVLAFTDFPVRNAAARPASAPPAFVGATLIGQTAIALEFDEDLKRTSVPAASAFTVKVVKVDGEVQTRNLTDTFFFTSDNKEFRVILAAYATDVVYGDMVTVSYAPPATDPLQDAGGNHVLAFTDRPVNVPRPASAPPAPADAEAITATTVAVHFDEDLDTDSMPAGSAFTVKVNGGTRTVAGVYLLEIDRDSVRLTVGGGVRHGDTVTVSYAPPAADPLQDAAGNDVVAFTDLEVRNDLTAIIIAPGAPTGLTASASGQNRIDVSWSAVTATPAVSRYELQVSDDGISGWTDLGGGSLTAISYPHTGLAAGTTKHYRVRAHNSNGAGAWSAVESATTQAAPVTCAAPPAEAIWSACLTVGEIFSTIGFVGSGAPGELAEGRGCKSPETKE